MNLKRKEIALEKKEEKKNRKNGYCEVDEEDEIL